MQQKVLLMLGASSECGLGILDRVNQNYTHIYAHYGKNAQALLRMKEKLNERLTLIQDDFSGENGGEAVVRAMREKGIFPDHVVHLPAAPYQNVKFVKAGWEPFEEGIRISVHSAVAVLQHVIGQMLKEKRKGRIIFMLSSCTENTPPKFTSPYVAVKYAMLGLMKALSAEYAERGITVNAVSPSMMETKFLDKVPELIVQQAAASSPFGRNLRVEDVVPVFDFLLSEKAELLTGQNIVISGGNRL